MRLVAVTGGGIQHGGTARYIHDAAGKAVLGTREVRADTR